jgi:hypothetical protein
LEKDGLPRPRHANARIRMTRPRNDGFEPQTAAQINRSFLVLFFKKEPLA